MYYILGNAPIARRVTGENIDLKEGVFLLVKIVFKRVGMDTQWLFTKKLLTNHVIRYIYKYLFSFVNKSLD
jgi:hypothetical protein